MMQIIWHLVGEYMKQKHDKIKNHGDCSSSWIFWQTIQNLAHHSANRSDQIAYQDNLLGNQIETALLVDNGDVRVTVVIFFNSLVILY